MVMVTFSLSVMLRRDETKSSSPGYQNKHKTFNGDTIYKKKYYAKELLKGYCQESTKSEDIIMIRSKIECICIYTYSSITSLLTNETQEKHKNQFTVKLHFLSKRFRELLLVYCRVICQSCNSNPLDMQHTSIIVHKIDTTYINLAWFE